MKTKVCLSSTALGSSNCINKFHKTVIEGYRTTPKASMVFGIGWHKYAETMFRTAGDHKTAIEAAMICYNVPKVSGEGQEYLCDEKYFKTVLSLMWMQTQEDKSFQVLTLDGKPLVEHNFDIPFYEDDTIVVHLQGTIDMIGKIMNGVYAHPDWKTTSTWKKNTYFKAYELSRQLRHYRLALRLISEREPESTIGKIGATKMGSFIRAIFLDKDINKVYWKDSEVYYFPEEDIEAYRKTVEDYCLRISSAVRTGYLPKEGILNGSCQHAYGLCDFWNVCKVREEAAQMILKHHFTQRPFTPLDYGNGE